MPRYRNLTLAVMRVTCIQGDGSSVFRKRSPVMTLVRMEKERRSISLIVSSLAQTHLGPSWKC